MSLTLEALEARALADKASEHSVQHGTLFICKDGSGPFEYYRHATGGTGEYVALSREEAVALLADIESLLIRPATKRERKAARKRAALFTQQPFNGYSADRAAFFDCLDTAAGARRYYQHATFKPYRALARHAELIATARTLRGV